LFDILLKIIIPKPLYH